jgi:putative transposase
MSSYRQVLYHLVIRTKNSSKSLNQTAIHDLYAYLAGILHKKKCFVYRMNGVENHIHFLIDLNPEISLADLVRDLKTPSSKWLKMHKEFKAFNGWSEGYGAFTISWSDKERVIQYIRNQQEHHKIFTFEQEYRKLLEEFGITFDEKYFP